MNDALHIGAAVVVSFLVGGIPFGFLIGRIFKGVDIRQHGSGNVGATNVLRVVGRAAGLSALALDILKGFAPTYFLPGLLGIAHPQLASVLCAAGAITGHIWTPYLGLRGGKGVATSCGAVLALSPPGFAIAVGAWIALVALTRYVSFASMTAAVVFLLYVVISGPERIPGYGPLLGFSIVFVALIFLRHRANIGRLLRGEESRFSLRKKKIEQDEA